MVSIDAHGGPRLPDDRVHGILRRSLERSPSFTPAERDRRSGGRKATLVATLEYRELPDATDHGRDLLVRLNVEAPAQLAEQLGSAGLDVTVLLEREAGEADLAADLQLATDRLATILQARTDLALGTPGTVDRLLRSSDVELLLHALQWIRDRGELPEAAAAADRVAELINHDDEDVGLLALETIGRIGGPQHVSAVLERIRLTNNTQVQRAYDAIAELGGPEAEGFLEFAARNEDEPTRRAAAERALRRVADSDMVGRSRARYPTRGHR
ncbi:MAG: HEAT repeat domain-containing protein [Enhygromyxa sp.]